MWQRAAALLHKRAELYLGVGTNGIVDCRNCGELEGGRKTVTVRGGRQGKCGRHTRFPLHTRRVLSGALTTRGKKDP